MNKNTWTCLGFVSFLLLILTGCGGDGGQTFSDSENLDASAPELISARALSNHYVEVSFDSTAGDAAGDPASYAITAPDSRRLQINDVSLNADGTKAILSTDTQENVDYLLSSASSTTASVRAVSTRNAFVGTNISFTGSVDIEPFLASAISLSNTSVLLTFSEKIRTGLDEALFYRISSPDLEILSADGSQDGETVLLTTEAQEHANYTVRVTNVKNVSGRIINPFLSTAGFVGILPDDAIAPQLLSADSLGDTQVLLSFNEPVNEEGTDPLNFVLLPNLVVTNVEFSQHRTQVVLTTLPQSAGTNYTVTVSNVEDDAGNLIDASANVATFSVNLAGGSSVAGNELPRVTGAASMGNTSVLVAFSKPMGDSAIIASRYVIVQESVNSEAGALFVTSAAFADADQTNVMLTTLSQNEVTYRVTAVGVKDLSGNALDVARVTSFGLLVDPTSSTFPGTPPSGASLVDFDSDGLTDNEEQKGWLITISLLNGDTVVQEVTSDAFLADTDGDGINDFDEKNYLIDPRDSDTDNDQLTDFQELNEVYSDPFNQDTDGDSLADGLEHNFFKISAILEDTDGDQLLDNEEIVLSNRDPRIADLPRPRIQIDNVNMALDTRFEFADTTGTSTSSESTVETTLTQGEDETFSTSNEASTVSTIEASTELTVKAEFPSGGGVEATVAASAGLEQGNTSAFGNESSVASEEAYHDSLTLTEERDFSQSVTRTVEGASLKVDMSIENTSDIPFTISNLELTAQAQDPRDRRRLVPLASLVPENPSFDSINLGTLGDLDRGPFVFSAVEIFPSQIENLMKSPRGLVVKLANFDITDEAGRNFVFTSQEVLDRTAGIDIDFGNGEVESYRVATHSSFDEFGVSKGITMEYALNDILGLSKTATIRDGGNGIVETIASGDDVQVIAFDEAVEPGGVVITAGPDGVLDSTAILDDEQVDSDYDTFAIDFDGDGDGNTDKTVEILTRVRDVETGFIDEDANDGLDERKTFWVVFASRPLDPGVDFDKLVLRAGEQYNLTFVQDRDLDGVWAREEFLHGSSDLDANTDGDGLTDAEEIQDGWTVQIRGEKDATHVYPNPVQEDSDRDLLLDEFERACGLDPRQRDTDFDGLTDWEELFGALVIDETVYAMTVLDPDTGAFISNVVQYSGAVILDGGNGIVETTAANTDVQTASGTVTSGGVVVSADADLTIESTPGGDDFEAAAHLIFDRSTSQQTFDDCSTALGIAGYATDPLDPDTDGDLIADGDELALGINPNDASDGPLFLDDDGDGVPNLIERQGFTAIVNEVQVTHFSNPDNPDSDDDGLPDLLEHYIGSNPQDVDTDGDGIGDASEYLGGGDACVTTVASTLCSLFQDKLVDNYQNFANDCDAAVVCFVDDSLFTGNPGTNLNEADSDFDSVDDPTELASHDITVNGSTVTLAAPYSDPLDATSDNDGWDDGTERTNSTNPKSVDTDSDGKEDDDEAVVCAGSTCRDPVQQDRKITVTYVDIDTEGACDLGANDEDIRWSLRLKKPTDGTSFVQVSGSGGDQSVDNPHTFTLPSTDTKSFIADFNDVFELAGFVSEIDPSGSDATTSFGPSACVGCGFIGSNVSIDKNNDTSFTVSSTLGGQNLSWSSSESCEEGFGLGDWKATITGTLAVD